MKPNRVLIELDYGTIMMFEKSEIRDFEVTYNFGGETILSIYIAANVGYIFDEAANMDWESFDERLDGTRKRSRSKQLPQETKTEDLVGYRCNP